MKKSILSLLIGSLLFSACKKAEFIPLPVPVSPCQIQTENPAGRSYASSTVVAHNCRDSHCGLLPLSTKNYWVYEDSIFSNGTFLRVQYDTLRYTSSKISVTDGLVWWSGNLSVGLPATLYTNDSAMFTLADRLFTPNIIDARKDFLLPAGDSIKYLANFDDMAANGRSVRLTEAVVTTAGTFNNCIYFEKNARNFRRDQVFFKQGLGVVKYIQEKAAGGDRQIKLQQVSTLVSVHIE